MDNDPCDTSDETFEIFIPAITVTQPNGGEEWVVGDDEEITWTWTISGLKLSASI